MKTPENVIKFYQSEAWKRVRRMIRAERMGVCEDCGGVGTEVHHIIPLSADNVSDPTISINPKNLQLLCRECHNSKRAREVQVRDELMFDEKGNLIKKPNR